LCEDTLPRKKPFSLKDQVATDKYGRRRFHGAFTGGFSAGFFNSVGSLEGWTPSTFKSSRGDKAKEMQQKPEDYMDEEVMVLITCLVLNK
jgi:G patch domain-containing protein 1